MTDRKLNIEVARVERAIVAAVAPAEVRELHGWIAAFDDGTVNRAKSAAPLSHEDPDAGTVAPLRDEYLARGRAPIFRVPELPAFGAVDGALARFGLQPKQPTDVQVAPAAAVARLAAGADVRLDAQPDAAWAAVFLGEGFDPVDGASRVRTLTRAEGSLFASIRDGDAVLAAGVLACAHGWASIHGMRTAKAHRGRGLATQVLAALSQAALTKGYGQVMLQVERANETAQRLYARCGFERAWTYRYWREP
jgi:ribosomal protein S18 acetylase RimI-like enzyme